MKRSTLQLNVDNLETRTTPSASHFPAAAITNPAGADGLRYLVATREAGAVPAAATGSVVLAGPLPGVGQAVAVAYADGSAQLFAPLGKIDVRAGDRITPGETVGQAAPTNLGDTVFTAIGHWNRQAHRFDPTHDVVQANAFITAYLSMRQPSSTPAMAPPLPSGTGAAVANMPTSSATTSVPIPSVGNSNSTPISFTPSITPPPGSGAGANMPNSSATTAAPNPLVAPGSGAGATMPNSSATISAPNPLVANAPVNPPPPFPYAESYSGASTIDNAHATIDNVHSNIDSIHATIDNVHSNIDNVHAYVDSLDPNNVNSSIDSANAYMDSINSYIDNIYLNIDSVNASIDNTNSYIDSINSYLVSLNS